MKRTCWVFFNTYPEYVAHWLLCSITYSISSDNTEQVVDSETWTEDIILCQSSAGHTQDLYEEVPLTRSFMVECDVGSESGASYIPASLAAQQTLLSLPSVLPSPSLYLVKHPRWADV